MKTIISTTLLLLIYIPAIAQAPMAETDPFTKHLLSIENPCEDELYQDLKKIDLDEMSDRQYEVFKQKDKACQDYLNLVRTTASQDSMAESMDRSVDAAHTYYIIAGVATLISVFYLFTI